MSLGPVSAASVHVNSTVDPPPTQGGEPQLRTRGMIVSLGVDMLGRPRGCYIVCPLLPLEVTTPENKIN